MVLWKDEKVANSKSLGGCFDDGVSNLNLTGFLSKEN